MIADSVFDGWTDEALIEYEHRLYDREVEGENTWAERDEVLWEIARRGIDGRNGNEVSKR